MLKQSTSSLSADAVPVQALGTTGKLCGDLLPGVQALEAPGHWHLSNFGTELLVDRFMVSAIIFSLTTISAKGAIASVWSEIDLFCQAPKSVQESVNTPERKKSQKQGSWKMKASELQVYGQCSGPGFSDLWTQAQLCRAFGMVAGINS